MQDASQNYNEGKCRQVHVPHDPPLLDNTTHNEWQGTNKIHKINKDTAQLTPKKSSHLNFQHIYTHLYICL